MDNTKIPIEVLNYAYEQLENTGVPWVIVELDYGNSRIIEAFKSTYVSNPAYKKRNGRILRSIANSATI